MVQHQDAKCRHVPAASAVRAASGPLKRAARRLLFAGALAVAGLTVGAAAASADSRNVPVLEAATSAVEGVAAGVPGQGESAPEVRLPVRSAGADLNSGGDRSSEPVAAVASQASAVVAQAAPAGEGLTDVAVPTAAPLVAGVDAAVPAQVDVVAHASSGGISDAVGVVAGLVSPMSAALFPRDGLVGRMVGEAVEGVAVPASALPVDVPALLAVVGSEVASAGPAAVVGLELAGRGFGAFPSGAALRAGADVAATPAAQDGSGAPVGFALPAPGVPAMPAPSAAGPAPLAGRGLVAVEPWWGAVPARLVVDVRAGAAPVMVGPRPVYEVSTSPD